MAGERIDIVNEYKVQTGQPLSGSVPFGFKIETDKASGRKKIIKDPDDAEILEDLIQHYMTHQSKKGTIVYANAVHHVSISHDSITRLLTNTMLKGAYRDNPKYCDAYLTPEEWDKLQEILKRNVKDNTAENRAYIFSGLIKCPECGCSLKGTIYSNRSRDKQTIYYYKKYRCGKRNKDGACSYKKVVNENVLEKMMLANIEKYMEEAKLRAAEVSDSDAAKFPKHDIDEIHGRIDRLNYSWQTGKIRTVEQYEKDYAELLALLEEAEAERTTAPVKDFGKVEAILHSGWEAIYNNLDDAYKRAFWRSFIQSIEIDWTGAEKKITRVNFF